MTEYMRRKTIARDISWLSFNARVLQEAADPSVPLRERIKFLGIFSNNMDEFFRVRVATLKRMIEAGSKANMHMEVSPGIIFFLQMFSNRSSVRYEVPLHRHAHNKKRQHHAF